MDTVRLQVLNFIAQVLNELGMGLVGAKLVPVTNGNRMTWHLSDCPT